MQFQHGTFVENADGSLTLSPFSVDGRELISAPCSGSTSTYLRYDQAETMEVCVSLQNLPNVLLIISRNFKSM